MCPRVVFLGTATSHRIDGGVLVCIVGALNGGIPYNSIRQLAGIRKMHPERVLDR